MLRLKMDISREYAIIAISWALCEQIDIKSMMAFRDAIRTYLLEFGSQSVNEHLGYYSLFREHATELVNKYYNKR